MDPGTNFSEKFGPPEQKIGQNIWTPYKKIGPRGTYFSNDTLFLRKHFVRCSLIFDCSKFCRCGSSPPQRAVTLAIANKPHSDAEHPQANMELWIQMGYALLTLGLLCCNCTLLHQHSHSMYHACLEEIWQENLVIALI